MKKKDPTLPINGKTRTVIENVSPSINGGRFDVKTIVNDSLLISADVLVDGHDYVSARILYKHESEKTWQSKNLQDLGNDKFAMEIVTEKVGFYTYKLESWVNHVGTWLHEVDEKIKVNLVLEVELLVGVEFFREIQKVADTTDKKTLESWTKVFKDKKKYKEAIQICRDQALYLMAEKYPLIADSFVTPDYKIFTDREKARFSAWYSIFPRSTAAKEGQHGTFKDVINQLPRVKELGFDVLYIPPIHPIGTTYRKGKNNAVNANADEPGVPYGIGAADGGHTGIHSELGTLADLKKLVKACQDTDIELAMDLAIQCSPDHPWVKDHPDWFKILPDGTIKYAENPPKKYQDIYPINFESNDWENLWLALKDVIFTWASWGVKIIRVDNPHTKAYGFWEWVIAETRKTYPEMIFLSEAFTKPKVMQQLGKVGFTQSYTYFTWRNTKAEFTEYMTELTKTDMQHYFRPNFWPNTHDINPYSLQTGHEPSYILRFMLAATLSSNYGVFGPGYEYLYHDANSPKEEYKNSEKYEIKHWDWEMRNKLTYIYTQINRIRKENSALQYTNNIDFVEVSNEQVLGFLKTHKNGNKLLILANLDAYNTQAGTVKVPMNAIFKGQDESYQVHDLVTGAKYVWKGSENFFSIDPNILPFHIFRIEDLW
jgi:starch synthase (maltosyl-transferring)